MKRLLMRRLLTLTFAAALVAAVTPVTAGAVAHAGLELAFAKAPVAPDGTTAGAATDFVITFRDRDPATPGIGLHEGAVVTVEIDEAFDPGDGTNVGVILQGWPQSPPAPPPFIWTTTFSGTTVEMTLTQDWMPGDFGPGAKQVHLALLGWTNPDSPGRYAVSLTIQPDPDSPDVLEGHGYVHISRRTKPTASVVSLFSGLPPGPPPLANPLYQTVAQGDSALPVGLYMWDASGDAFTGVDARKMNARWYRLVDGRRTVGHVRIDAPRGARHHEFTTAGPSTEATAFLTGVPVGVLITQFTPDPNVTGDYTVRVKMNGGTDERILISVVDE